MAHSIRERCHQQSSGGGFFIFLIGGSELEKGGKGKGSLAPGDRSGRSEERQTDRNRERWKVGRAL